MEKKIVGAWSWTYIEGVGRIIFTADHKVREGFPPEDKDGRKLKDEEFEILMAGTWRLEGDVLVTEMDNTPHIKLDDKLFPDEPEEVRRQRRPALKKEVERQRIVRIDAEKMVFEDGGFLDRIHP